MGFFSGRVEWEVNLAVVFLKAYMFKYLYNIKIWKTIVKFDDLLQVQKFYDAVFSLQDHISSSFASLALTSKYEKKRGFAAKT